MLVTVFTDAGLCHDTHRASWGAWVKSARGVTRGGGILRAELRQTEFAEAMAVVNAIHLGMVEGTIQRGDSILIQTDNIGVPRVLQGKPPVSGNKAKRAASMRERKAVADRFNALLAKGALTTEWRHVKAHQGNTSRRSSVNTYCDRVARFFLDIAREEAAPGKFRRKGPKEAPYGIADPRALA